MLVGPEALALEAQGNRETLYNLIREIMRSKSHVSELGSVGGTPARRQYVATSAERSVERRLLAPRVLADDGSDRRDWVESGRAATGQLGRS